MANTAKYNTKNYDILIVGAGPFGATFAHEAAEAGKNVLVIDKRAQVGGNVATEKIHGINVHTYGAHIFHTNDTEVWDYVHKFGEWRDYQNHVVANYHGEMYSLPFNMYTFNKMWPEVRTPDEALAKIESQKADFAKKLSGREPANLEEQAISLVGRDVYEKLIKGYTEKQWGRKATELPAFIIKRLPVRLTYENNYFNDRFQGMPADGYAEIFANMLNHENIDVKLNTDFLADRETFTKEFAKIVYTGPIDAFYDYKFGELEYRGLRFERDIREDTDNAQGNAVVNYTDAETPYTRIMEWRHFDGHGDAGKTILTREYPADWHRGEEPYYPVNDDKNAAILAKYQALAKDDEQIIFGGRLAEYVYYNMDQVFRSALDAFAKAKSTL